MRYHFFLALFVILSFISSAKTIQIYSNGKAIGVYEQSLVKDVVFNSEEDNDKILAKYRPSQIEINTSGSQAITSKEEYIDCKVDVKSDYEDWCYSGDAQIRGRGNSSWYWYDKKPYRIKLKKKASILGMPEGKSWVLLADFRDPTHLMNTYVFTLGKMMGLKYTNDIRYAQVTLNGENLGMYIITEQVQQGKGRVNIDEDNGYLISLDADDGPYLSPEATDNFWSEVYEMPVCVKNPDDVEASKLQEIKYDLADLEYAILEGDYEKIKSLLDIQSMIDYMMIQEFVYNVELDAPRSMYMYKDIDGDIWHMGPLWDFDAAFDFDWSNMYTGHDYFESYKELVLGTDPKWHWGTIYQVPAFFSDLFFIDEFVKDYKNRWLQTKSLTEAAWYETLQYVDDDLYQLNSEIWPIGKDYRKEIERMGTWLKNRANYMNDIILNY